MVGILLKILPHANSCFYQGVWLHHNKKKSETTQNKIAKQNHIIWGKFDYCQARLLTIRLLTITKLWHRFSGPNQNRHPVLIFLIESTSLSLSKLITRKVINYLKGFEKSWKSLVTVTVTFQKWKIYCTHLFWTRNAQSRKMKYFFLKLIFQMISKKIFKFWIQWPI